MQATGSGTHAERYSRQICMEDVGLSGQQQLKDFRVVIIGLGGLGAPVAQYLTGAGIGTLGLMDDDVVSLSNLARQPLYGTDDVGHLKTTVATRRLSAQNSDVRLVAYPVKASRENILDIMKDFDAVVDGTDNFAARYLISDACVRSGKPHVYASVRDYRCQVAVFGGDHGCYRCLFPNPPRAGEIPSCVEAGTWGPVAGVAGSLQAGEIIKLALGRKDVLWGAFLTFDMRGSVFRTFRTEPDPQCVACGPNGSELSLGFLPKEKFLCAPQTPIDADALVIDVREPGEFETGALPGAVNIPLSEFPTRIDEMGTDAEILVYCKSGVRSAKALEHLRKHGFAGARQLDVIFSIQ